MKKSWHYYKGARRYVFVFMMLLAAQETLLLALPLLLRDITNIITAPGAQVADILGTAAIALGVVLANLFLYILYEYYMALAANHYAKNVRAELFEKIQKLPSEKVNEIGSSKLLTMLMNDSSWLKDYQRKILTFWVYMPVTICGSFVMLLTINPMYALIAFTSVPVALGFFLICSKKLYKPIDKSIKAFDEMYKNLKEGLIGAKEIRMHGKAEERTQSFNKAYTTHRMQALNTDRAINLSTSFNAFLYTIITIVAILYCAYVIPEDDVAGRAALVALSAAIMYINKIWTASHYVFKLLVEYIPRNKFTVKRYSYVLSQADEEIGTGLTDFTFEKSDGIEFTDVGYNYDNETRGLQGINLAFPYNTRTAVVGKIGSGKNLVLQMLLRSVAPSAGHIKISGINIADIERTYFRKSVISFCAQDPQFVPGTVRDNLKLLYPEAKDKEIREVFEELGALGFFKRFRDFLNFQMGERSSFSDSVLNLLNIVRTLLKPAKIYVFYLCFEHIKHEYIEKLMAKLKREKKTAIFITHKPLICKKCDKVYLLKNGKLTGEGTHDALLKNADYKEMLAVSGGQIIAEEVIQPAVTPPEASAAIEDIKGEVVV